MTEHRTDNATTTPPPRVPLIASAVEEEEPEDPKPAIEEACAQSAECKPVKARFDACNERVTAAGEGTEETCVEEFFDLMHCINEPPNNFSTISSEH